MPIVTIVPLRIRFFNSFIFTRFNTEELRIFHKLEFFTPISLQPDDASL